jgi:hypothetical protein
LGKRVVNIIPPPANARIPDRFRAATTDHPDALGDTDHKGALDATNRENALSATNHGQIPDAANYRRVG